MRTLLTITLITTALAFVNPMVSFGLDEPQYGGTLYWGTDNPPQLFDVIGVRSGITASLFGLIFDSLVNIDSKGNFVPGVAESWEIDESNTVYTFHLRDNVKFQDGKTLTADDVVYTLDLMRAAKESSPLYFCVKDITEVKKMDSRVLEITFNNGDRNYLYYMMFSILPDQALKKYPDFYHRPVGSGMYRFIKWDTVNQQIELEANPDYFDGRPYINRIVVKTYADKSSLWAALMRQEIDMVRFINRNEYEYLKNDQDFNLYSIDSATYYALLYNTEQGELSSLNVRQAIAMSLDIPRIIEEAAKGNGRVCTGPFLPGSAGYDEKLQPFAYDPQQARAMLKRDGWRLGKDGILEKKGKPFVMQVLVNDKSLMDKKIATMIRQQLAEVGIVVKLVLYKNANEIFEDREKYEQYDAWLNMLGGINRDMEDSFRVLDWFTTSSFYPRLWKNKPAKFESLISQAKAVNDLETKIEMFRDIQNKLYQDQPVGFLFIPSSYHAISADIKNVDEHFSVYMPPAELKNWFIAERPKMVLGRF